VLSEIGSFGGLFRVDTGRYREPVLVASADGVGTKLKVAFMADRHDTVGIDLVNHCVNDILVQGAEPLFFLDYLATGRLAPDVAASIVEGMARACRENRCALLGGETAEMPGFYGDGEYDLAGFIVGVVERSCVVDGRGIVPGDVLIGLPSSGLHTNGYSLARRILFDRLGLSIGTYLAEVGRFVGEALLVPHRSYLQAVRPLLADGVVKGMAHITGGGITENLPRVLPEGTAASVRRSAWRPAPIFEFLQDRGEVPDEDMWRTFNMGIGLILVVPGADAGSVIARLHAAGETGAVAIGEIVAGKAQVLYVD
jgi:phosphoribosylformylglycinamidine cyclo-ligase